MLTLEIISPEDKNSYLNGIINREEIRMDELPTKQKWALIPLYKMIIDGEILFWQIGFDGINNLEINQGIVNSDENQTIHIEINNIGGMTMQQQALKDAHEYYRLKFREGYLPAGSETPNSVMAMKGYEYKLNSIKRWPVYTQPKLNGIRMLCQYIGENTLIMKSWLNNPFTHLNHLEEELKDFFSYLPRYATLDGELYNHNMNFTTLISAVKTVKTEHPRLKDVQYWIFDINYEDPEGAPYEKRCALLINAFRRYIQDRSPIGSETDISVLPKTFVIVPTQIAKNHEEILGFHDQHIANGYEGIMIKKISNGYKPGSKQYEESLYKSGKNNHILKYKQFIDEEAIILNIINNVFYVQDCRKNIFPVKMREDSENIQNPIGKEITIRYHELLIDGIPKYPIGIAIRDYE